MDAPKASHRWLAVLALSVFLLAPSFDTALKYLGTAGVAAFFIVGTATVFIADAFVIRRVKEISARTADIAAAVLLFLLAVVSLIVYPMANSGQLGAGSDADDALITAATALLNGSYPYTSATYLGNLISPMPGSVLLAIPFVIIGAIVVQNIFWLAALFAAVKRFAGGAQVALGLLAAMLIFSPTLLQNLVTGADYTANSIYVLLAMWMLVRASESKYSAALTIVIAIFLGVALSSRSTFMLTMPLLLSVLVQNAGWAWAIKYLFISGLAFLAVTLPFWLYDPAGFAPLKVQSDKLLSVRDVLPYADMIIPGAAALLSVALSFGKMKGRAAAFLLRAGIVQIFVLFFTSAVHSIKLGRLDLFLQQSGYGMFTLFFGATAMWIFLYVEKDADPSGANA